MGTPTETGSTVQSGYNEGEFNALNKRFGAIEQLLELDTRFAGLQIPGKVATLQNGGFTPNVETLVATGAISISKLSTKMDATTGNQVNTLAAPTADGQLKLIQMTATASSHTASVSGTNVQGQSGKVASFANVGDTLVMISFGGAWVKIAGSVSFA